MEGFNPCVIERTQVKFRKACTFKKRFLHAGNIRCIEVPGIKRCHLCTVLKPSGHVVRMDRIQSINAVDLCDIWISYPCRIGSVFNVCEDRSGINGSMNISRLFVTRNRLNITSIEDQIAVISQDRSSISRF